MKRILIVANTYYPDSMATIGITQRFAEALAASQKSDVTVFAARPYFSRKPNYNKLHNGVRIVDRDDIEKSTGFKTKFGEFGVRVLKKINRIIKRKLKHYRMVYETVQERDIADRIIRLIRQNDFDEIVTIALPFRIHREGYLVKKRLPYIKWTTISFDPYAYDVSANIDYKKARIREEEKIYKAADKVMFLSQFSNDYSNSKFCSKITYFELPNIRRLAFDDTVSSIAYDDSKINCVYLGNFYLIQRHPKYLLELFDSFHNKNIVLYIVGNMFDIPDEYIHFWMKKMGDRLKVSGRVSQQEAINDMLGADVLINVGQHMPNQCPSKVLDYISTGKPILNISKVSYCTSKKILDHYPSAYHLFETESTTKESIAACESFLQKCKEDNHTIPFDRIVDDFSDFTMTEMIKRFFS